MDSVALIRFGSLLIAAGLAFFIASFRIGRLARRYRQHMENLLQLSSRSIDPLELPAAAWPELSAGGWRQLSWEGSWFGQPVAGKIETEGAKSAGQKRTSRKRATPPLDFTLNSGDEITLNLHLIHADAWGENRLFAEHLARVFVLLLEMRLHARTEALSAALAERARLSLYLQHDMRNLAQWVLWVGADFKGSEDEASMLAVARRLRSNAPLAMDRAERLIAALGKNPQAEQAALVELHDAARQAARLAGLEPEVVGSATAWVAPGLLARAFDNLLTNIADAWRGNATARPLLEVSTRGEGADAMAELRFVCPWLPNVEPLATEKLFEPFASGRPRGLGLGLYQARKSLREAGGDLQAQAGEAGLAFLLRLPAGPP